MTLASLAQTTDLPVQWATNTTAQRALDIASEAIRNAAGSVISQETTTVVVVGSESRLLRLPGPISSVASVTIGDPTQGDIGAVTDYIVLPEGLYRECGWLEYGRMIAVTVTYTFGYASVPLDIVDMCATLAVQWLTNQQAGGGSMAGVTQVRLDDAQETYTDEYASAISAVFIPKTTRDWLRARFGGGATVVEMLR